MKILRYGSSFILLLFMAVLFNSCKSLEPCPDQMQPGNAGNVINTSEDEFAPFVYENKLYFTSARDGEPALYYAEIGNDGFLPLRKDIEFPLNRMEDGAMPAIYKNEETTELYFSAANETDSYSSRDIFFSKKIKNKWTMPRPVENINTEFYESYPAISKDGDYLLFISDREGGAGGIDIYVSMRQDDGGWSEAINLGDNINTSGTELSPHLDDMNNLYFASNGYTEEGDFEIFRAEPAASFKWDNPKLLDFPINSEGNETGAFINEGNIYVASDRVGGCGKEDIYSFYLCGPVLVKGEIIRQSGNVPISGSVFLLEDNEIISEKTITENGRFTFNLEAMKDYTVEYNNDCFTEFNPRKALTTPCSDTSAVVMQFNFVLPKMEKEFDFAEYEVPFFVSGYYYPNTDKNLEDLRLKFSYNIFTDEAETRYIENPDTNYDQYTGVVESALNDAYFFVEDVINSVQSECALRNLDSISIKVKGYSDPRQISEYALYMDNDISDEKLNIEVSKGSQMDNKLLSELRAYFTAKYIEQSLKNNPNYSEIENKVNWTIEGMGIDESDIENKLKRRVQITIKVN